MVVSIGVNQLTPGKRSFPQSEREERSSACARVNREELKYGATKTVRKEKIPSYVHEERPAGAS